MNSTKKYLLILWSGLLFIVLLGSGCIKVTQTNPANGSTGVIRDVIIKVTFNSNAKPDSINAGTFFVKDCLGNSVPGEISYANKVVTFTPTTKLSSLCGYTVTLTNGIKDFMGFPLTGYSFVFTTSDGAWGKAQMIETYNPGNASIPQVGIDASGNALAVWAQDNNIFGTPKTIWANSYTKNSGWGKAQMIGPNNGNDVNPINPQIAVNANGDAVAVWSQLDGFFTDIWANYYTKNIGWGTAQMIETYNDGNSTIPQIAIDIAGNAIAVWAQDNGASGSLFNIWSNHYTPGSGWSTAQLISPNNRTADTPEIAVDVAGNAIAVWSQWNGIQITVWSNRYTPNEGWDSVQQIATHVGSETACHPKIAVDTAGNAIAMWDQGNGTYSYYRTIWSNRYTPGLGWGEAQLLIETCYNLSNVNDIVFDSAGNALAMWEIIGSGVWSNRYTPNRGWETKQLVVAYNDSNPVEYPQIAIDAAGNAIAVWDQYDGERYSLYSRRYTPSDGWKTIQLIPRDYYGDAHHPQIDTNETGDSVIVWIQPFRSNEAHDYIFSNRLE